MSLISQRVEDIFGGVSQSAQLAENEFREQLNALPVFAEKRLKRRPPIVHKAKLTTDTAESAFEMKLGDYTVLIVNGIVQVLESLTGTLQNVFIRSGQDYINAAGTLRGVTVGDTAIICNQGVAVAKDAAQSAYASEIEAYLYIRQGDFSTTYTVTLNSMPISVTTPDNTLPTDKPNTTTSAIATALKAAILADPVLASLFSVDNLGSTLRLTLVTGADFSISGTDGLGDQGMLVIKGSVQQFSDLPPVANPGSVLEVTGAESTKFDNYYVQFVGTTTQGTWREVAKPGSITSFDPTTLPIRVVKNGDFAKGRCAYGLPSATTLSTIIGTLTDVFIPETVMDEDEIKDVVYPKGSQYFLLIYSDSVPGSAEALFMYTVTGETETATEVAAGLTALIDAHVDFTASSAGNVIIVNRTVPTIPPTITAFPSWDLQHNAWSPDLNLVTNEHVGRQLWNLTKGDWAYISANGEQTVEVSASTFLWEPGDVFAIRDDATYFIVEECPWEDRRVGDDLTAPFPSCVEKTISDIFVHQGRLGFLCGAGVVTSRAGSLYDFFRTTATEILASDPIDVSGSSSGVTEFHSAIEYNDRPYLWTDEAQYRFGSDGVLTPETVSLTKVSAYRNDPTVRPVVAGSRVFFVSTRSGFCHVHDYRIAGQAQQHIATDLTLKIPSYINGTPVALIADDSQGIVILSTDTNDGHNLYPYCYFYNDEEQREQTAWGKWTFASGRVLSMNIVDGVLVLIMAYADGTYLNVMPFDPGMLLLYENFETFDGSWDYNNPGLYDGGPDAVTFEALAAYLDRYCNLSTAGVSVIFDGVNTVWTLPYAIAAGGEAGEVVVTLGNPSEELTVTRPSLTKVSAVGNYSGEDVNIGVRYASEWTLPTLNERDTKDVSDRRGRLQVRFLRLLFENLVRLTAVVSVTGRSDRTYVSASPEIVSGEFVIPVQSNTDNATILLRADSAGAESLSEYAWEATLHLRTRST